VYAVTGNNRHHSPAKTAAEIAAERAIMDSVYSAAAECAHIPVGTNLGSSRRNSHLHHDNNNLTPRADSEVRVTTGHVFSVIDCV
jgi:hypothetical protein